MFKRFFVVWLLVVMVTPVALAGDEALPAYREEVTTPHWEWVDRHAGGTVKVLFITSFLSMREADELSQRFDIEVDVVPVKANPSAIPSSYDEAYLAKALAARPDVIFVAYRGAWGKLSKEALEKLATVVVEGTPLIALSPGRVPKALRGEAREKVAHEGEAAAERNLAVGRMQFPWGRKDGRIGLKVSRCGKGRFINVGMGHGAGGRFNAFIPSDDEPPVSPSTCEIAYAMFARLVRWAAGKTQGPTCSLRWEGAPTPGGDLVVSVALDAPAKAPLSLDWDLRSPFGDPLAKGTRTITIEKSTAQFTVRLPQSGDLTLQYRLRHNGAVTDFGAVPMLVPSPLKITDIRVPRSVKAGQAVPVEWTLAGEGAEDAVVLLQVYDPDDRLVAWRRCARGTRQCRLSGWQPRGVTHRLRLLALGADGSILDERRLSLQVPVDRARDPSRYHVMVWATEKGATQEQWRYRRLRQLGITVISPVGRGLTVPMMASEAGLRLAPVNVCVPPNRFKKTFDPAKEKKELQEYVQAMAPMSPLGYSLADEPANAAPWRFRDWAADLIHRHDPDVPVGYCGARMQLGNNVPRVMQACDFLILYTPHHLYDTNMWRGIEREYHRSFARPDSIVAAYTQYAPWKDHEPYSRTVPWLFLFDENNGISFFASAGGNFSILPSDLRTTHETRWWSEEIHEIQKGIGTQIIAMTRDTGGVAVLFPTGVPNELTDLARRATTVWADALHELTVPFVFIARGDLETLSARTTRLLVCPATATLTREELAAIRRYVADGGTLVATLPFALVSSDTTGPRGSDFWKKDQAPNPAEPPKAATNEKAPDLGPLFGLRRGAPDAAGDTVFEAVKLRSGISAQVNWKGPGDDKPVVIDGLTGGRHDLTVTDADVCGTFEKPGEDMPEFAREALSSPAALRHRHGKGSAYYLNFTPSAASARTLVRQFRISTDAPPAPAVVTVNGEPAEAVYLYPFTGGGVRALGVIQDYARVNPVYQITDEKTALYYHHGPHRWKAQDATLVLNAPAHVYNMRSKQYLGHTSKAPFRLRPGEPCLFALLPYRVRAVAIEATDRVAAGTPFTVRAQVRTERGDPGNHVVHVRLQQRDEPHRLGFDGDVMLQDGRGSFTIPTAFNDTPGEWTLDVTDTLSGQQAEHAIHIAGPGDVGPLLPERKVALRHTPLDWPQGTWQPYVDPDDEVLKSVRVSVGKIQRKPARFGNWDGRLCLMAKSLVKLESRKAAYNFRYFAGNDWKREGWDDKRRVKATYSGLGMNRPAGHLWYYQGYLSIFFDDVEVTGYRIAEVREVDAGTGGRVDVTWESPAGEAVLSFGMTLDGDAVLQQLRVRPTVAVQTVSVRFCSYIGGFGQTTTRYVRTSAGKNAKATDPKVTPWAFYADDVNDRAYGKGMGAGGILVTPGDWDSVKYGNRGELKNKVDLKPGQVATFHWALWLYADLTNAEAFKAFRKSIDPTATALREFFAATRVEGAP